MNQNEKVAFLVGKNSQEEQTSASRRMETFWSLDLRAEVEEVEEEDGQSQRLHRLLSCGTFSRMTANRVSRGLK